MGLLQLEHTLRSCCLAVPHLILLPCSLAASLVIQPPEPREQKQAPALQRDSSASSPSPPWRALSQGRSWDQVKEWTPVVMLWQKPMSS